MTGGLTAVIVPRRDEERIVFSAQFDERNFNIRRVLTQVSALIPPETGLPIFNVIRKSSLVCRTLCRVLLF